MARRNPTRSFTGQVTAVFRQTVYHQFGGFFPTETWTPAVNVYQCQGSLKVCVDLAGIQRQAVEVRVEPGKLLIQGVRQAPEPCETTDAQKQPGTSQTIRILGMEIDHGPFRREIPIPTDVDITKVHSRYDEGLLWITLPIAEDTRS